MKTKKKNKSTVRRLFDFISDNKIAAALCTALLALLATFLAPVKDKLFYMLWPEKIDICVIPNHQEVEVGRQISFDIILSQKSDTRIRPGVVEFSYDSSYFKLRNQEQKLIYTEEFTGTIKASKEPIVLIANEGVKGKSKVFATFKNASSTVESNEL